MIDILEPLACETLCKRLSADFAHFADSRDYEKFVALFTEDGTFERRGETLRGRSAILRAMHARPDDMITRHICTNIRIDTPGNGIATGAGSMLLFHRVGSENGAPSITVADYRDIYIATADGWRIQERVSAIVFNT
ncbi:nuclear transport factor 2 family protein [Burkholderia sp. USMB20]|uniref:nuclear transport factor 2 family protein n=1 Tax=Burkholderia sp. USMB20 TaxID=1571773 RepID=UPI00069774BF|nr:nuclear transport factor 2 family protein [Burkholderia sp. USMB20]TGN95722.1 nuclear transport factor 2 family protein [Burkholderia sp. USMB20]